MPAPANTFSSIGDALKSVLPVLRERQETQDDDLVVGTGFDDVGGLRPSELIVLAAHPSHGKTAFAMSIAANVALVDDKAVAIFSMKSSASQLAIRMISALGRVKAQRLHYGQLDDEDWLRVQHVVNILNEAKIFIDDTTDLSLVDLRDRAHQLKRDQDIRLIVVDALQMLRVPGSNATRSGQADEVARALKELAKELHVPVLALFQLDRRLESRGGNRPTILDLRDYAGLVDHADVVLLLHREAIYDRAANDMQGIAEVIIAKDSGSHPELAYLRFFEEFTRFDNMAPKTQGHWDWSEPVFGADASDT